MKPEASIPANVFLCTLLVASSLVLGGLVGCTPVVNTKLAPRDRMVLPPEQTQKKYDCGAYTQVMLRLEETWVLPEAVTPGDEIKHSIRYAFCPSTPAGILKGNIIRTVLFKGNKLFDNSTDYEFKPGTWLVEVFIGIPKEAESGAYALDVVLRYADQATKETKSFIVKGK